MSERTSYAPGTPCWVELATPDIGAAESFYGDLFGWEIPELPNSAELGGYRRAKKNGKDVAGVAPIQQEGQPPSWNTYVSVADAKAALTAATEAGGTVIVEALDVRDLGTMGVFTDPTGAVCGVWQPGTFLGSELVNEPGTVIWNELNTRDPEGAKTFYGAVLGWGFEAQEFEGGPYTTLKVGEDTAGGILDITGRVPEEVPPHWLIYFDVEDVDATVEKAKAGGGEVVFGPADMSKVGRISVLKDPFGAVFALIAPDPEMQSS
jgi:predicted enzyme related to lactoylglutathione lyase